MADLRTRRDGDTFVFNPDADTEAEDGLADSLWLDLGAPQDPLPAADDGPTCSPDDVLPVLMVLAGSNDFYFNE